jgi:four helix bundle protein
MSTAKKENIILDRSFEFSLKIIELYKHMVKNHEYVVSRQLLKSGTSIGANVNEAQAAQSKRDFVAKMCIASKETRETKYWISLLDKSNLIPNCQDHILSLYSDIDDIINILSKIVKTSSLQEK